MDNVRCSDEIKPRGIFVYQLLAGWNNGMEGRLCTSDDPIGYNRQTASPAPKLFFSEVKLYATDPFVQGEDHHHHAAKIKLIRTPEQKLHPIQDSTPIQQMKTHLP
jgi:hypothetical protein